MADRQGRALQHLQQLGQLSWKSESVPKNSFGREKKRRVQCSDGTRHDSSGAADRENQMRAIGLRDLGAEDKKRLKQLIEDLALAETEREKMEKKLMKERQQHEQQLSVLRARQSSLIREKGVLEHRLNTWEENRRHEMLQLLHSQPSNMGGRGGGREGRRGGGREGGGGRGSVPDRGRRFESCSHAYHPPPPPPPVSWSSDNHLSSVPRSCQHWSCQDSRHHIAPTPPSLSDSMCTLPQVKEREEEEDSDPQENHSPQQACFSMQTSFRPPRVTLYTAPTSLSLYHPLPKPPNHHPPNLSSVNISGSSAPHGNAVVKMRERGTFPPNEMKTRDSGTSPIPSPPPSPLPTEMKTRDSATSPIPRPPPPLGVGVVSHSSAEGDAVQITLESVATQTEGQTQTIPASHQPPWSNPDLARDKIPSLIAHDIATEGVSPLHQPLTSSYHQSVGRCSEMTTTLVSTRGKDERMGYSYEGDQSAMEEEERDEDEISVLLNWEGGSEDALKRVHEARHQRKNGRSPSPVDSSEDELLEDLFFVQTPSDKNRLTS